MQNPRIKDRFNLKFISLEELQSLEWLSQIWGDPEWRKHESRELVKNFDLELEHQDKIIRQFA